MARQYYKTLPHDNPQVGEFDFALFSLHMHAKRWQAGYTTRGMADIVGTSASTISRIERGKVTPKVPEFLSICYWFQLNPMDYFIEPDMERQERSEFAASEIPYTSDMER